MGRMRGEAGDHGRMNGFPKTGTKVWYKSWYGRQYQLGDFPGQVSTRKVHMAVRGPAASNPSVPWLYQDWNLITQ